MHTLRNVSTNICGRMRNSASTLVYAEYARDRFKYVTNTLQYVGIHNGSKNCVHAYMLDIS